MDVIGIIERALVNAVGRDAIAYSLLALGLNIHFGYTGLLNFGQVAFAAAGAYGVAITVNFFGLSLWTGLLVGLIGALVFALVLGIPTLRLRTDYLAITTIAFSEIVRLTVRSVPAREVTGGSFGLGQFADAFYAVNPFPAATYGFGPWRFGERATWVLVAGWSLVALAALISFMLMRSPWGRVVKSIREDEDAARSLGKNVYSYKLQSLALGGVFGCLAGFVFAIDSQSVQPDFFATPVTFFAYTALITGGTARIFGPIVGSMIFWMLLSVSDGLLRGGVSAGYIPPWIMNGTQVGQVRFMLVGLGLMLLMIFRPQGVFGDKKELALDAR